MLEKFRANVLKFFSKHSPDIEPLQFYVSQSLELVTIINVVIGGFSGEDLK